MRRGRGSALSSGNTCLPGVACADRSSRLYFRIAIHGLYFWVPNQMWSPPRTKPITIALHTQPAEPYYVRRRSSHPCSHSVDEDAYANGETTSDRTRSWKLLTRTRPGGATLTWITLPSRADRWDENDGEPPGAPRLSSTNPSSTTCPGVDGRSGREVRCSTRGRRGTVRRL